MPVQERSVDRQKDAAWGLYEMDEVTGLGSVDDGTFRIWSALVLDRDPGLEG